MWIDPEELSQLKDKLMSFMSNLWVRIGTIRVVYYDSYIICVVWLG